MNMKTLTICKIDKRPDFSSAQFLVNALINDPSNSQYSTPPKGVRKNYFLLPTPLYPTSMLLDNGAYVSTRGTGRKYTIINKKDFNRKD